jgi:hypothetical protein
MASERPRKDVLYEGQYRKAKGKAECPNTKAAVLIDGKSAGSIFYLCQIEKCGVHNRVTRYQPTPQEQAQRKKEALAERVEKQSRVRILEAIRKNLPEALSRPDLEMVALDYFRSLEERPLDAPCAGMFRRGTIFQSRACMGGLIPLLRLHLWIQCATKTKVGWEVLCKVTRRRGSIG